jgi:endogenous inhibitor of DNA gyrase (YacG/DUF329 family)
MSTDTTEMRSCVVCGLPLNRWAKKYCSQKCNGAGRKVSKIGKCPECGKDYETRKFGNYFKTCSRSCAAKIQARNQREEWLAGQVERIKLSIEGTLLSPLTRRGLENKAARSYSFLSPNGRVYEGINVYDFIRTHEHLFDHSDVVWRQYKSKSSRDWCRASVGLTSLLPTRTHPSNGWKGWVWYGAETRSATIRTELVA